MWPVDDIFVLPGVITSLCLDTVSARMDVGHLLLPGPTVWNSMSDDVRDPTLSKWQFQTSTLKLGCFQSTSTYVSRITLCGLYKFTTYLLTYFIRHLYDIRQVWQWCGRSMTSVIRRWWVASFELRALSSPVHLMAVSKSLSLPDSLPSSLTFILLTRRLARYDYLEFDDHVFQIAILGGPCGLRLLIRP